MFVFQRKNSSYW